MQRTSATRITDLHRGESGFANDYWRRWANHDDHAHRHHQGGGLAFAILPGRQPLRFAPRVAALARAWRGSFVAPTTPTPRSGERGYGVLLARGPTVGIYSGE